VSQVSRIPTFDILGFGATAVDDLLYVDGFPEPDGKVRVQRRLRQCGGLTGTALVAASRLGANCAYVGMLGDDDLSRIIKENFVREGVDIAHVADSNEAMPGHSTIIVDERKKTRAVLSSLGGLMGADPNRPDPDLIRAAHVLLIDHHGLEGSIRAARIAREASVAVVADFERDPGPPFRELLPLVDHLVISERFALQLTGETDTVVATQALLDTQRDSVVVTCGAQGCWHTSRETSAKATHSPAMRVAVVDTTGCGDVFHGAYAASLARGDSLSRRIQTASIAAALKATQPGGQSGCPTMEQVEAFC